MTTLTIKVPDGKAPDVSSYISKIGGEVLTTKKANNKSSNDEDDDITHEVFFGENIKRLLNAFKK
jgi:hypothetical protein